MKLPKDQPFWTSVILHVVVLLALFLATIIEYFRPEEEVHVFEMVSASAPIQTEATPTDSTEPPPPDIDMPDLDLTPVPEVPVVQVPPPPVTPPPAPTPARPTPPKPPKQEIVSYEDFLKKNKIREPRQPQRTTRPVTPTPQISIPQVDVPTITHSPQSTQPTAAQMSALNQYKAQLSARLKRAWLQPSNMGGLKPKVKVSFYVSAGGSISQVRLVPGSGNDTFDRSVLAAFRTVGNVGATPTGQGYTLSINFELD